MRLTNLHDLPKVRDRLTYLYVERARIDREAKAIAIHNVDGVTPVPCAGLACLMLGPGCTITHAAVVTLADCGCLVVWCGESGVRFYSAGVGATRNADNLRRQAALSSNQRTRLLVVRRLYGMRFEEKLPAELTLQQIRGREGVRVREAYARMAAATGVAWSGRSYNRGKWGDADPVNRALSAANSCLYGICHAAIVAAGYSPALGFIHIGKQLSFVYDVADLYKADLTVPVAFRAAASVTQHLEREVWRACRDVFARERLLERIVRDMDYALQVPIPVDSYVPGDFDEDAALPGGLWDPEEGAVAGGTNYGELEEASEEEQ